MIRIGIDLWMWIYGAGGGIPPVSSYYLRPDGVSLYRRPDGTSLYIRP
jgi:hypothetical protein